MSLYLVATPIGNLGDVSQRAIETLRTATIIAAEDTRSARRLLAALSISAEGKRLVAYGDHNEAAMAPRLAEDLRAGTNIALISEGGTPLISDPGYRLVQAALACGAPVVPIPGPSAALAALAASGLPVHGFIFRGFLPKKPGARRRILESLKDREETLIFYESPQRVAKVLPEFVEVFGPDRPACLARELTKVHETFWRLPLGELAALVAQEPPRGECTLLVAGVTRGAPADDGPPEGENMAG
ncbi:MAG: 16S rRNA (cytidine(1402)-2'-O)-methyltransferase [Planctomycetota bacterium]|nr:16S rRNA (cytidine(1402)-2'-O)-methyltransferase [Planctomycetota bacterium]